MMTLQQEVNTTSFRKSELSSQEMRLGAYQSTNFWRIFLTLTRIRKNTSLKMYTFILFAKGVQIIIGSISDNVTRYLGLNNWHRLSDTALCTWNVRGEHVWILLQSNLLLSVDYKKLGRCLGTSYCEAAVGSQLSNENLARINIQQHFKGSVFHLLMYFAGWRVQAHVHLGRRIGTTF